MDPTRNDNRNGEGKNIEVDVDRFKENIKTSRFIQNFNCWKI